MATYYFNNCESLPIGEFATIDYIRNSQKHGVDSDIFQSLLVRTAPEQHARLHHDYESAFKTIQEADDLHSKIAILQLREGEEFQTKGFSSLREIGTAYCEDYELVYVRNNDKSVNNEDERIDFSNDLYSEFTAHTLRPRDYYGHSLSVSDIIVYSSSSTEQHAYYIDRMGFIKLPDDFLSLEMSAKIRKAIDVRQENELYRNISKFEVENEVSIQDSLMIDRHFLLNVHYSRIFDMADRRGAIMDMDELGYAYSFEKNNGELYWASKASPEVVLPITELEDVQEFIAMQRTSEYRRRVQAIFEYEIANDIPEQDRITTWVYGQNVSSARVDRGVSEKDISDKYAMIQITKDIPRERLLSEKLAEFYKDYDLYDYRDSLDAGDTDEDAIKRIEGDLTNPEAVNSFLQDLKEIATDVDLSLEQKTKLDDLIKELTVLYVEPSTLTKAKKLIDEYCRKEFDSAEGANYADLSKVNIAYTTTEDEKHTIQSIVNLKEFRIETYVDDTLIRSEQFENLDDMNEKALPFLSFDDLVYVSEDELAKIEPIAQAKAKEMKEEVQMEDNVIEETLSPKEQLQQRLENGVRSVLDSEMFKNWLNTSGKLFYRNYSFQNAMLIWLQKPDASYVMSYEKWKDFGRNVTHGAQGAKIFVPLMASEHQRGGLFKTIKNSLLDQLSKDSTLTEASYRLGTSGLEFTMNRTKQLIGFKVNGNEKQIFGSDEEAKRFIDRAIIGKVPVGFTAGTVFDVNDVAIPEYLWVKRGYTKDEIAPDEKGNAVKNKRGEVRIVNTAERQSRFQTALDMKIVAKDPAKMQVLFDACVAASERKGVPVILASKTEDEVLRGGASGYYSRKFTEEYPKGFIVIDSELEHTEKCSVLFHEMGHADLHKNLKLLAQQMGEDKITSEMREVQAEAVAFSTASAFGIETDTSSFSYLAVYSRGFELQDFKKSLEVIHKETQALTNDIKAELDIRGFNLDLTEKPHAMLELETLKIISTKHLDFASEQRESVEAAISELPQLVKQSATNPEILNILRNQGENLERRRLDLDKMLDLIEQLNNADTRQAQDNIISNLEGAMRRIETDRNAFDVLSEQYVNLSAKSRDDLTSEFRADPKKTLEQMKKEYPALAELSSAQIDYIAKSKFIFDEVGKELRNNPQGFVDKVIDRAELISKAASKNGTFVEINYCEQWTDKPFFAKGTLCSPKIADKTISGYEAQTQGLRSEASARGEYFPYTKCDITVFTPNKNGSLISLNTRVDIGDGSQSNLKEHLEQVCKRGAERKTILANFEESLSERADKRKLIVPDVSADAKENSGRSVEQADARSKSATEWTEQISATKKSKNKNGEKRSIDNAQRKNKKDKAE